MLLKRKYESAILKKTALTLENSKDTDKVIFMKKNDYNLKMFTKANHYLF